MTDQTIDKLATGEQDSQSLSSSDGSPDQSPSSDFQGRYRENEITHESIDVDENNESLNDLSEDEETISNSELIPNSNLKHSPVASQEESGSFQASVVKSVYREKEKEPDLHSLGFAGLYDRSQDCPSHSSSNYSYDSNHTNKDHDAEMPWKSDINTNGAGQWPSRAFQNPYPVKTEWNTNTGSCANASYESQWKPENVANNVGHLSNDSMYNSMNTVSYQQEMHHSSGFGFQIPGFTQPHYPSYAVPPFVVDGNFSRDGQIQRPPLQYPHLMQTTTMGSFGPSPSSAYNSRCTPVIPPALGLFNQPYNYANNNLQPSNPPVQTNYSPYPRPHNPFNQNMTLFHQNIPTKFGKDVPTLTLQDLSSEKNRSAYNYAPKPVISTCSRARVVQTPMIPLQFRPNKIDSIEKDTKPHSDQEVSSSTTPRNTPKDDPDNPSVPKPVLKKANETYRVSIIKAILSSPAGKLSLAEIYEKILEMQPIYRDTTLSWKNAVRHNLSKSACFIKVGRTDIGRGFYWAIHPSCVQAFKKGDFDHRQAAKRIKYAERENTKTTALRPAFPPIYQPMNSVPVGNNMRYNNPALQMPFAPQYYP